MKTIALPALLIFLAAPGFAQDAERPKAKPPQPDMETRLANFLKKFPDSDLNKDGELTREEVRQFNEKRRKAGPGEGKAEPRKRERPQPTVADVKYGEHEKQAFDLWPVPDANEPTPLAIYIHGGGFRGGDKRTFSPGALALFHENGIAFCSMNYRLSDVGPYPIMMEDAARGLQTIRHRAKEWNIDPEKIACYGGSAGAGISLWLAFHDDLADPDSDDPIAKQSSRIVAAATSNGQSTYDMRTFREWFEVPGLKPHEALIPFYGVKEDADWETDRVKKLMTEASSISHLSNDDTAPVYMAYSRPNTPVDAGTNPSVWVHHVKLGLNLQEAMEKLGLECIVRAPDVKPDDDPYGSVERFIAAKLKGE
ncbi:MAG: alpha/beta hydrolase [Verrucomicrobiales bacterium]|nr:alpha/beta hydrolase [Verrucomicrobiales bacterium]